MESIRERAHAAIDNYFEAELGGSFTLPDKFILDAQRNNFLRLFGIEPLAAMSDAELLRMLPYNVTSRQPMDYWLEFKNDDQFESSDFGSVSGGTAAKFGTWQEKDSKVWRAPKPRARTMHTISQEQALEIVRIRRDEILRAVEAIRPFGDMALKDIDPAAFQRAVEDAAPTWHRSAWLHKYLHIVAPSRVTWDGYEEFSKATLYRSGVVPTESGLYGRDIQIIRFWSSFLFLPRISFSTKLLLQD